MQIIGQRNNLDIINSWKEMPQFIILQGDADTGKHHLAIYLCQKFNLHLINMSNSVKEIRGLLGTMSIGAKTVYYFDEFDKASLQAKNALLKITEEPIKDNYIIVAGARQLNTLESRAYKLVMSGYSFQDMQPFMEENGIVATNQEIIYRAGINTPSKLLKYKAYPKLVELARFANETISLITTFSMDRVLYTLARFESKVDNYDTTYLFISMMANIIEYKITQRQMYDYFEMLDLVIKYKEMLKKDTSLNRKYILYQVLYGIHKIRG